MLLESTKARLMAVLGEHLFYRSDMVGLSDVLRNQVEQLRGKVDALSDKLFHEKSDEEIAKQIADAEAITPLALDFASAKAKVEETVVEVQDQFGFNRGPIRVAGLIATKSIPFTGDPELWRLHPGAWSSSPPRGEVRRGAVVIGMTVPAQQADQAARYIEETIAALPDNLAQQKTLIDQHNASLAAHAMPLIRARRSRLGKASELLKRLGG
jgi:uncharacterized coiled-coil protein SlyX